MGTVTTKMKQVVDWSAALWGGIIAGIIFLIVNMVLTASYVGSPWVVIRLVAAIVLGPQVLPPPASFQLTQFIIAMIIHLILSIGFASIIAIALHRWGLLVGIIGGAIFGLAFYFINFYTLSYLFPWFFPMRSWIMMVSHIIFGALAGGTYEALEVEKFIPVEDQ